MSKLYYVSSKLKHRDMWVESGINTISSWVTNPEPLTDPDEIEEMWDTYRQELGWADAFVMYLDHGDVPKGALIELGIAFDANLPIYFLWHGSKDELENIVGTIVHHNSVTIINDLKELPK